jgi:hypothetical protein
MSNVSKRVLTVFLISLLAVACSSPAPSASSPFWDRPPPEPETSSSKEVAKIEYQQISLSKVETKTRDASVKIYTELGGHGSGTYFLFEGYHVVFTAAHVAVNGKTFLVIDRYGNKRTGVLAYKEIGADFAIILIPAFKKIKPIKFKTPSYDPTKEIGRELTFSGYPGRQSLRTVRGLIAGVEGKHFILHSTAWKGSSGSCVFDSEGNFVGILFAISMSQFKGIPVLLESMIWVDPYTSISWVTARKFIKALN